MTYKTDFKFGLLILAILAGTYLFAVRAIRSDRLIASEVEAKLRLNMSQGEIESIMHKSPGARAIAATPNSIVYSLRDPKSGLTNNYHFNFDAYGRLTRVTVDDEFRPGSFVNRTVALK